MAIDHKRCYCCDIVDMSDELVRMTVTKTPQFCTLLKHLLKSADCNKIMLKSEQLGFQKVEIVNSKGEYRKCKRVIIKNDLDKWLFTIIKDFCPPTIVSSNNVEYKLVGVNNEVKVLKYESGDHFKGVHCDETYIQRRDKADKNKIVVTKSMLTIAIFLNDDFRGGHLEFSTFDKVKSVIVGAKQGSGVLFQQTIPHFADGLIVGVKYLLRADVMYEQVSKMAKK